MGKWGLQEVDLNPSLGFVHLGYGTMQTTTHCVVELVSGHSSDMKHVVAVGRDCMVCMRHKVAHCGVGMVLVGHCGGIGHVMSV